MEWWYIVKIQFFINMLLLILPVKRFACALFIKAVDFIEVSGLVLYKNCSLLSLRPPQLLDLSRICSAPLTAYYA